MITQHSTVNLDVIQIVIKIYYNPKVLQLGLTKVIQREQKEKERKTERQKERMKKRKKERKRERKREREKDRKRGRQKDRKTEREEEEKERKTKFRIFWFERSNKMMD